MANRHRGEIDAVLDGRRHTLCLTLGSLAELEAAFQAEDLAALADRFGEGRLRATDAMAIIAAGLRGAGHDVDAADVARMRADGGATGFARIVTDLLVATFGSADPRGGASAGHTVPLAADPGREVAANP